MLCVGERALFAAPDAAVKSQQEQEKKDMPLVRIDLRKGKGAAYRAKIGRMVYDGLVSIGAPEKDRFQIIAEHEADSFSSILNISASTAVQIS